MTDFDQLGSPDEGIIGWKTIYFLYIMSVFGILFYGSIGANITSPEIWREIMFYIGFGFIMGTCPFLIDNMTKGRDALEELDTVSLEEPPVDWFTYPVQVFVALLVGFLLLWKILITGTAWVGAPVFGIFDSPLGNAVLSGLVGIVENHVFFGFVYPTAYAFVSSRTESPILAIMISLVFTIAIFSGYHMWRYGTDEAAMISVALFALINTVCVLFSRSLIISDGIHFFNNLGVGLGWAKEIALTVLF